MANVTAKPKLTKPKRPTTVQKAGGGVYFLAMIGALVHFWQNAPHFGDWVLGFLKALVWPAMLAHKIFDLLKI